MSLGCAPTTSSQVKEVQINLFHKFDGTFSKFQGFFNQVRLIIRLHPHYYPNGPIQASFISMSLLGTTLVISKVIYCDNMLLKC
jgi:uncharacterized protein YpmS